MVHRNTEYRLKYYFPNEELSKKIWLDNIKFRETRRAMNLADHYWHFQTANLACDCNDCTNSLAKCNGSAARKGYNISGEYDVKVMPSNSPKINQGSNNASSSGSREVAVQTPNWISTKISEKVDLKSLSLTRKSLQSTENERTSIEEERTKRPLLLKKQHGSKSPSTLGTSQYYLSKRLKDLHEMQSLFFPFGWKNDNKNIGNMKTFNVLAPQKEVHAPAVMAMKRRKAQLENSILSKDEKRKQKSASLLSVPRINHSSIWITEYRDKFSKNIMATR